MQYLLDEATVLVVSCSKKQQQNNCARVIYEF